MNRTLQRLAIILAVSNFGGIATAAPTSLLDSVAVGNSTSENSHAVTATLSKIVTGGLNQPARELLPRTPQSEYGGSLFLTVKCDPKLPTYVTIKFWGSDAGETRGRLLLFVEGKQLGVRHLGAFDDLDILSDAPRFVGRFFYKTIPLPMEMTAGKASVKLEIRSLGRIWGYGATWAKFQYNMVEASRGIYAVYTHTDPYFVPPTDEKQGPAVANAPVRTSPGPEVLTALKERVSGTVNGLMKSQKPLNQMQIELLARAYRVKWTPAYQSSVAIQQIIRSIDALYLEYRENPKLAQSDPVTPNPGWFGFGPVGDAIRLTADALKPSFDEPLAGGAGITRRRAWTEMLVTSRDWNRRHRRLYTNQSMIKDCYGIYLANRGIAILTPAAAIPEAQILHYFYQSVGLEPWLGSDTDNGPEKPVGDHYMELTDKGLTRELGYVGAYGEVLDWVTTLYNATRPEPDQPGDPKIKAQLIKIAKARGAFREPLIDADGNRAMALETVVGWRDNHYPGDITYGQRTTWDAGAFDTAATTLDPTLVGYAQQMLADNQFFAAVKERMENKSLRVTAGLLETPDAYDLIRAHPAVNQKLPMTPGQPDFLFSDEEDGVLALKHGDDVLYASLYWRARFAINNVARVHLTQPSLERDATCWEQTQFDDSGLRYTVDDRVIESQTRRYEKFRGDVRQALQGEVLPIAKIPAGTRYKVGDENVYAGKGTFYTLRYGPYLIGMNMTPDRQFDLAVPAGATAVELPANTPVTAGTTLKVPPRSTMVLFINSSASH